MKPETNKNREFGSAPEYYYAKVNGKHALFTESQIAVATERAKANPEDIPSPLQVLWWRLFRRD